MERRDGRSLLENGNILMSPDIISHEDSFLFSSHKQSELSYDGEWGGVQISGVYDDEIEPTSVQNWSRFSTRKEDMAS